MTDVLAWIDSHGIACVIILLAVIVWKIVK
jgi:hypothetical protein